MPRLTRLSGLEVVAILRGFGFELLKQEGSHMKLRRLSATGRRETVSVPRHRQLVTTTLFSVYKQARQYIPEEDLRPHFYTE